MGKDYTIRIEAKEYTFEFELKDPRLREIYDQDPEYVYKILRATLMGAIGDLHASGDLELKTILNGISSESTERKISAISDFEKQLKPERLH